MRYVLDFGSANAGSVPTFGTFKNADTLADIVPPAIVEIGGGLFYFDYTWSSPTISSIVIQASVNGVELSDIIRSDQVTTGAVSAGAGAGVNPWLWTAGQVLNMAATECGLAEVADPYASTDPKFVQLRSFLKTAGDEISKVRDWSVLVKECTITGDGATTIYALPDDFLRMKDESGWNRSNVLAFSPLSSQAWQAMRARTTSGLLATRYRIQQGRMVFYEAPALDASLAYEYVSRYWVASDGAALADSYYPAAAGDRIMLEPLMVMRLVKAKFLQAKGFDSAAAFADYAQALEAAAGLEPAPVLSLGGCSRGEKFIDTDNIPERLPL